jgi:UDP-2,3-diacylglucosamine pyrophosphatase LpxH
MNAGNSVGGAINERSLWEERVVRQHRSYCIRSPYVSVAETLSRGCAHDRSGFPSALRLSVPVDCTPPYAKMRSRFHAGLNTAQDSRSLYRSIWISDFHLGTQACQAEALLEFLCHHQAEKLYLVGDIVDGWNPGSSWWFDAAQKAVTAELRAWQQRGTHIEFLPGNHDEASLDLVETLLGLVPRRAEVVHRTADGRRMLVTHGHQFDRRLTSGDWLKGKQAYTLALRIHQWYGRAWMHRCQRPRSLSAYLRHRVKQMVEYLTGFDDRAVFEAVRQHRADGLICGHVHRTEQRLI